MRYGSCGSPEHPRFNDARQVTRKTTRMTNSSFVVVVISCGQLYHCRKGVANAIAPRVTRLLRLPCLDSLKVRSNVIPLFWEGERPGTAFSAVLRGDVRSQN